VRELGVDQVSEFKALEVWKSMRGGFDFPPAPLPLPQPCLNCAREELKMCASLSLTGLPGHA